MDDTVEIVIPVPEMDHDALLAELDDWDANGFVQAQDALTAYVPAPSWSDARRDALRSWLAVNGYAPDDLDVRLVPAQNWNAVWESHVTPIRIGDLLLKPTWAEVPPEHADADVIEIDPKMSFGTGHHATTRLTLRLLLRALRPGDHVLDVGTGTGILAIAACRRGASHVTAVEIEAGAVENARENIDHNGASACVDLRHGTLDAVAPDARFDLVTANVTRDVLTAVLPDVTARLADDGRVVVSGLFSRDRDAFVDEARRYDLTLSDDEEEDGWWGALFKK